MHRVPSVRGDREILLQSFELVSTPAGQHARPEEVAWAGALAVGQPAPVAAVLASHGQLDLSAPPDLDGRDHWYRAQLPALEAAAAHSLSFEGLATLCEVWLDGVALFSSESMFERHTLDVTARVRSGSELALCFRALTPWLAKRRPRPRWRTRLVDTQQLRFARTSLLGRTPGFSPRTPVVGPYRPIRLISHAGPMVRQLHKRVHCDGKGGSVALSLTLALPGGDARLVDPALELEGAAGSGRAALTSRALPDGELALEGTLTLPQVARWWPHTHGEQPLSALRVVGSCQGRAFEIELGKVGFRTLEVERDLDGQGFGLRVNDVPVFCRGACWTTDDVLAPGSACPRRTLELARRAGMNMLRVPGITSYESDAFFEACDELGVLVFQDFMFANMDYPATDPAFLASVEREVTQLLTAIGQRPSLAVLCGGSEVEQQAAMLGMPRELWTGPLFSELLPALVTRLAPSVPYVSSSPTGGELPFQVDSGLSHYYGVGAYLRPLDDARRAQVRFTTECLAFANPPVSETVDAFMRDLEMPFHHPRWKERVPRDRGVGWDFEDVRDHYLERLFGVSARELRYADPERYLSLSKAAVGEVMLATFSEFRRAGSSCRGALVFWLKDLWDGAGWGVIDARGRPKSAYYYLQRALRPSCVLCTDEGLNGVAAHVLHDAPMQLDATLTVRLFRGGEAPIAEASRALTLAPHTATSLRVDGLFGRFTDSAYAYRFGPPAHDLLTLTLASADGTLSEAFHLPTGHARPLEAELGLEAQVGAVGGRQGVHLRTRRFAQAVSFDIPGFEPDDDWFHIAPGGERFVALTAVGDARAVIRGSVAALNSSSRTTVTGGTL